MVILRLKGGLGNQLFQWFFARSLGHKRILVDTSSYKVPNVGRDRNIEISAMISESRNAFTSRSWQYEWVLSKLISILDKAWEINLLRRLLNIFGYVRDDSWNIRLLKVNKKLPVIILNGYFQNHESIYSISHLIKGDLQPHLDHHFSLLCQRYMIPVKYDVIHVRREDYPGARRNVVHIGILNDEWFVTNISRESKFLIFLIEDSSEAKVLIEALSPNLILDQSNSNPWEALALMSKCTSGIGSNSTLSWWGAKLCKENGGKFVLPSEWSQNKNIDNNRFYINLVTYREPIWKS